MEKLYNQLFLQFLGTNLNLCRNVSDILKLYIGFDEEQSIFIYFFFYKIMAFSNLKNVQVLISTG